MAVQVNDLLTGEHLRQPDDRHRGVAPRLLYQRPHLLANFRRIGSACAEYDLRSRIEVGERPHQVQDPLLTRNAAHEEDDGQIGIDAAPAQHLLGKARLVLVRIDSVVDHANSLRRNAVQLLHVIFHRLGHGDDAVCVLVCRALDPGGRVIGAPQLLRLPGAVRLQRMGRQHQRRTRERARQAPRQVRVPGVTVHDVGRFDRPHHRKITHKRVEQPAMPGIVGGDFGRRGHPADAKILLLLILLAEGEDVHCAAPRCQPRQFAREVLHMNASPAVDIRRVLVGKECDSHRFSGVGAVQITVPSGISAFLRITTIPSRM